MVQQKILTSSNYVKHHLSHWQIKFCEHNFFTLNVDTMIISSFLGISFLLLMYIGVNRATAGVPGKFQNTIEWLLEWIDDSVAKNFEGKRDFVTPLSVTIFVWVLLMNSMDLIPIDFVRWLVFEISGKDIYFRLVPTADLNVTFSLSLSTFLLIIFYNIKYKSVYGFTKEIFTSPFGIFLFPLNIFFRFTDELVKPLSLSLRLYGNLFAGELIFILIALLPWWIQWIFGSVWSLFHVLVIVLQSFVFMMLTVVYLSLSTKKH